MNLGLGTAAIGRPQYINIRQEECERTDLEAFKMKGFEVLERAYQLGIRYFDTAPGYGLAEQLLLDWLSTKNDTTIQVATKWGYTYVANFNPNATIHEIKEHSIAKLNEQWSASKGFSSHLKVYQIHSATLETGVLSNTQVLNRLAFLKHEYHVEIGITTTGANQIEVIKKALDVSVHGDQLFDTFQVTYNILDQSLSEISDELMQQNKRIIVKEALANGRLFRHKSFSHYNDLYTTLEALSQKYQVGTDAIALKFCQHIMEGSMVLSGASNKAHLEANLKINEIMLTGDDMSRLKEFKTNPGSYWQERKQLAWN